MNLSGTVNGYGIPKMLGKGTGTGILYFLNFLLH